MRFSFIVRACLFIGCPLLGQWACGSSGAPRSAPASDGTGDARGGNDGPGNGGHGNGGSVNAHAGAEATGGGSPAAVGAPSLDGSIGAEAGALPVDHSPLDGPTGEAFDTTTGLLAVDRASYLSKHDVVFNGKITDPIRGLTVGNGRMGMMVWNANGLTMQVSGVDTSQQTAFSAGLANLATLPAMDASATTLRQRLVLYDGLLTAKYDADRTVTVMGSPKSEVMGIHVEDGRSSVTSVSFTLGLWDLSALGNNGNVRDLNTWKTVATYADASGAGVSRGQTDPDHFGYTLAATVEGAPFTTTAVDGKTVKLTITPSRSYTIWIASATRLNAPNHDSVAQAKTLLGGVLAAGYEATLAAYEKFWHEFWSKSFVQYSNAAGDADYLENFYYLATYVIAAGAYGTYPFHFINGVFRATGDATKWSNAYWYWNQRDVYASFLASNHGDVMSAFNAMYANDFAALKAYTMTRYGIDGIWVPETMGWNGNADGTVNSDYTKNIYSTGAEAAENMYRQYAYTGDSVYLSNTAYPFIREVVKFYQAKLSLDAGSGRYYMASSNAHETYWNVKNAITDLAAVRSLFPVAIQVSERLGLDASLRAGWQNVLDNLAPYATDGTNYLPHDPPTVRDQNDENVACEPIWPYGVTGIGAPDYDEAVSTWNHRPHAYDNVWANDAIQAARLGLGDEAMKGMKLMLQKYQSYPNGMTNNTNGVFEYFGVHLSVMNEALLQSHGDKIRVFPALPSDPAFVSRFTLAAEGGFLVSAEREEGEVKYVGVKSLSGNTATVENPWPVEAVQVRRMTDGKLVANSTGAELTFPTSRDTVYVVERVAKPFGFYAPAHISGASNQDGKRLLGTTCTLGLPTMPPAGTAKYEAK
jgi:alpha-L-fucosidase 2